MTLQLTIDQLQQITAHAERSYPEECCGLLLGQINRTDRTDRITQAAKMLVEAWEVENAWSIEIAEELSAAIPTAENQRLSFAKTDRYWIDPRDLLRAQRYARDHQLDLIGIYHSHPDHAATPSECDRSLAWSQYSYLIVSVQQGIAKETRCWSLDEYHQFQPEEVVVSTQK